MADNWSLQEVEATVADYFEMLDKELHGLEYNKTVHRRYLSKILKGRSDGAIERKHQNISAVLQELGFPWVQGYKPLGNYQHLLFEIVSRRYKNNKTLIDFVHTQVDEPAVIPAIRDILSSLVNPPDFEVHPSHVREPRVRYDIDYFAREANNRSLGSAGEQFVVIFEKARLTQAGKDALAMKVEQVSETIGDSAGFDVLSFETDGRDRLIEVKTTAYGPHTPFFVTQNELSTSNKTASDYHLYRAFNFRRQPRLFTKQGPLDRSFRLDPTQYMVSIL